MIVILFLIDLKLNITDRIVNKMKTYIEIIISSYLILFILLIAHYLYESNQTADSTFLIISLTFLAIASVMIKLIYLTHYYDKTQFVLSLCSNIESSYHKLICEQNQQIKQITELGDFVDRDLVDEYINNHKLPIYSNDIRLNFLLYYIYRDSKQSLTMINGNDLTITDSMILHIYYISILLDEISDAIVFSFNSSPIEQETLILTVNGNCKVDEIQMCLSNYRVPPKLKKTAGDKIKQTIKSIEFLENKERIISTMQINEEMVIKYRRNNR